MTLLLHDSIAPMEAPTLRQGCEQPSYETLHSKVNRWDDTSIQNPHQLYPSVAEIPLIDPSGQSQGFRKSIELTAGLNVLIDRYTLHEDLIFMQEIEPRADELEFELSFMVQGYNQTEGVSAGQNFLAAYREEGGSNLFEWTAGQQIAKLDIHFDLTWIQQLIVNQAMPLPTVLQQTLDSQEPLKPFFSVSSPAMQTAIAQVLNSPYQGFTQRLYLESKVMELLALQLEQIAGADDPICGNQRLTEDDLERLHYAKELLLSSMGSPPSLIELARQVGLNDYKLKLGFRQVFETTVFGYLHNYRLEQAKTLLARGDLKVAEVATEIGFASRSHFSTAFRKRFGITPKGYQMQFR